MTGIYVNFDFPMFIEIGDKRVDTGETINVYLSVEPDEMLGSAAWYIRDVEISGREIGAGQMRKRSCNHALPVGHWLRKPIMDWAYARCNDAISEKWEDYLLDAPSRRADAKRAAAE